MRKRNRADFAPTRGWDKLNGSEQYDRMVYIQEELERRQKEREKEEEIGYNTINGRNKQRDVWNGQWPPRTMEHRAAEAEPQRRAGRETPGAVWSGPAIVKRPEEIPEDAWDGLDWRGRLNAISRIERPKQQEAWIAGEREAANQPTTGRAGAELLMADVKPQATRKKEGETEEVPLFFPGGSEEMMEYLREHPDATLPNGLSGRMVAEADKIVRQKEEQELNPAAPGYLKTEDDIREMQEALGVEPTGVWDGETDLAYKERMDEADGLIYQDEEGIAGLPFDQNGMEENGCATTATHNVLEIMGVDVPFEETYAWHRENGDAGSPGTIPWRTEKYIREEIPEVNIRNAAMEYPVIVPETEDTMPLEERAQRVIGEDGYGILCYAYKNEDGSLGAHYVAVEKDPERGGIVIYDYVDSTGKRNTEPQYYDSVHDYMQKRGGFLFSAYGLSKKEREE